ncbi:MAG TPA: hypothetical protein VFO09_05525, partial [Methyloceanibacter sp.]|nr:hypothetical protein [Methyloceanibacter sp.]
MRFNGHDLRRLVLAEMLQAVKAGRISRSQYRRARKIRFPETAPRILGTSLKVEKSVKVGYLTAVLYLAPEKESVRYGGRNLC